MALNTDGYVLRAPRTAPANAITTDEASNGVSEDFKALPAVYTIPAPEYVNVASDQYRSAILLRTDPTTEYLIWAANTANLGTVDSFTISNEGTGTIPEGTLEVANSNAPTEPFTDGTTRLIIIDDANRTISLLVSAIVTRGDDGAEVDVSTASFNPVTGVLDITEDAALITALGGGFSSTRGDRLQSIEYSVAPPTFWWTKNDRYELRFVWKGAVQRWEPLNGTPPRDLGILLVGEEYLLSPAPTVTLGEYLPGDSAVADSYSMVRIGARPDSSSIPVAQPVAGSGFGGLFVVTDEEADEEYDFTGNPTDSGVIGNTTGKIQWNPTFIDEFAGQSVFYSYRGFVNQDEVEALGSLNTADLQPLFVAPIPGPTDYPFIRIGSRNALEALLVETDVALANQVVVEGQVAISLTTGRMKFSDADIAKTDPSEPTFDKSYLDAQAFFDGVSLSQRPLPLRAPVALVDGGGNPVEIDGDSPRYIPDAAPVTAPGVSGVQFTPDETGTLPNTTTDPSIRPNPSGLVRDVRGPWDLVLFGQSGQFRTLRLVDDDDEIPKFAFRIPRGTAIVDLREGSGGSRVHLSKEDQSRFSGELLYFLQSGVEPSVWADQAQIFSRVRREFVLVGDEVLVFRIGTNTFTWDASTDPGGVATSAGGTFLPADIATSLDAVITNTGSAVVVGDKVVLQGESEANGVFYGEIEIGFGPNGEKDLSGPTALGFLPAWMVRVASPTAVAPPPDLNWLPDSGTNLGVFRSPLNINGRKDDISDINSIARFDDIVLQGQIPASPIVLLPRVPLEDVAGYDENVFFSIQDGFNQRFLQDYETIYYEFGLGKFSWASTARVFGQIEQPTPSLLLGNGGVIPSSFQCPGKGLRVSEGGPFIEKELGVDFDLLDGGASGIANLINSVGASVFLGGRGSFTAGSTTFTDPSADVDFVALGVKAGYQLEIQRGDAEGVYIVTADATATNSLEVSPAFVDDGANLPWEVFEGIDKDTFDPGIIADVVYTAFNHLPEEPFRIRQLSSVDDLPADAAAQTANRLFAYMADALSSGRIINMRFGLPNASPTSSLVGLTQTNLGRMANDTLVVPTVSSERFANGNFDIRVNTKTYTFANGDLIKVPALSTNLAGDVVEVQESDGLLSFGAEVFVQFEGSDAVYAEIFLDPDLSPVELPAGTTEYDPVTGLLNFSALDMAQYGGTTTYFVEQMITTNNQDVTINAIQGSFAFSKPLREFQIVEVDYFLANNGSGTLKLVENPDDPEAGPQPVRIIEFLPLFVREEVATALSTGEVPYWGFNPTERTTRDDIDTLVWIGGTLTNVGSSPVSTTEFDTNRINFEIPVADTEIVKINYAVLEAFGGEESYTCSQQPVYRPPFFIEAEKSSFELAEDRTDDVLPGQLLRLGAAPFYLTGVTYDAALDITTVEFIPETTQEAGSRNAGDEAPALLSGIPIAKDYNPEAPDGFWQEVTAPYQPVNRGYVNIIFLGDFTQVAVTEHILEISGFPFVISGSTLSDDGTKTTIEVTAPFPRGFGFGTDPVRISVRPIYAIGTTAFLGRGGLFPGSTFDAVLFGETNGSGGVLPGRVLRLSIDYEIDTDSGEIEFLNPPEGPVIPGETLYLRHIQVALLSPFIDNDVTIIPAFTASYTNVIVPTDENGIEGRILKATYTFSNPDTFFYRAMPLLEYIGEVAENVARDVSARLPSQGPAAAVPPPSNNANEGRLGLKATLRDFQDQDRAGRVFLEFYNEVIVPFEQILETISGNIVGDRDGKFRFFIGRGKEIPPPGYENAITGDLNERNAFTEVFLAFNAALVFLTRDPVVDPATAVLAGDQIEGDFPDSDLLGDLIGEQRTVVQNDVDDIVLIGRTRKRIASLIPFKLQAFGRFRRMGEANRFSRIYPERTEVFTQLDPGIQSDLEETPIKKGVYSFRKRISRLSFKGGISLPKRASTFRKSIGQIENPVLGQLENISSIDVVLRFPRARIFAYSDIGFPELDSEMAAAGYDTFTARPRPAVIATVLPFNEFPVADNGLPDLTQLIANGGDLPDLSTGDPTLFTPPWEPIEVAARKPMISFGRPDGRIIDVATGNTFSYTFLGEDFTVTKKVFVSEVALGCVITFTDQDNSDPNPIGPGGVLELSEDPAATNPPIELFQGDTVFVTPPDAEVSSDVDAAPTQEEKTQYVQGLPGFRNGFDIKIDRSDGEYRDNSLPSFKDPSIFGLKEIFGQEPPKPMDFIDAEVAFRNGSITPAPIPALTGGYTNDSGDYTLPYLYAANTEIDRLGLAAAAFLQLLTPDTPLPSAVFPDEILGADGTILAAFIGSNLPAVLLTSQDATPVTTAGAYAPHSGIGDVEQYDFLFVESGQAGIPNGAQGMLSVGSVTGDATGSVIEPPRFVTHSVLGDRFRYRLRTALSFVNQLAIPLPATPGMVIDRPVSVTRFNITSVSSGLVVFNDGSAGGLTGGLNNVIDPGAPFAYPANDNSITINIWTADTGAGSTYLQTVILKGTGGVWNAQTQIPAPGPLIPIVGLPTADDNLLSVDTAAPIFTIAAVPAPGELPEDPLNPGQSVPLWFTVDVDTSSAAVVGDPAASQTGFIATDRLTFDETLDLRGVLPRDEVKPDAVGPDVFSELEVFWVESGTTDALSVNDPAEVNGGSAFTFLRQSDFYPFAGSTFDSVALGGTGRGTVKVPAFEGHGNTPIVTGDDITFSAIPSSLFDETGLISGGTGTAGVTGASPEMEDFRILSPNVTIAKSLPGDILTILGSANATPKASSKNGTYLVKHAIEQDPPGPSRNLALTTTTLPFNTGVGWAQVRFPPVTEFSVAASSRITVDNVLLVDGVTSAFPASGRLYVMTSFKQSAGGYLTANYYMDYSAVDTGTGEFTITPGTLFDFGGTAASAATIDGLATGTTIVAGFNKIDIAFDKAPEEVLPRNLVGLATVPLTVAVGFTAITVTSPTFGVIKVAGAGEITESPAPGEIEITAATPIPNGVFVNDENAYVYDSVPQYLELDLPVGDWDTIHSTVPLGTLLALMPEDALGTVGTGYQAQAGIFLEPTIPRSTQDLNGPDVQVVDASHSLAAADLGYRSGFGDPATVPVTYTVRRIRRYHEQLEGIGEILEPLKFAYLIRRGTVATFGDAPVSPNGDSYPYVITSTGGTQLGNFDSEDVNINPGDTFRLLDTDGKTVLDAVEIAAIEDGETLALKAPGFTKVAPGDVAGKSFEIFLRTVPVPHEQSNEQLRSQITQEIIFDRSADYLSQEGGWVPTEPNPTDDRRLQDTDLTINFAALGVEVGDILLIDPAGEIEGPGGVPSTGQERGFRPFGDRSVPERTTAQGTQEVPFEAGGPAELDDNRGWYRVSEVLADSVVVSSETIFTNPIATGNVTFGSEAIYAVYPTVSNSGAAFSEPPGAGVEGQMDLRPTAFAGDLGSGSNSFKDNLFSVAPFTYRIFRPSGLFSDEAIDIILMHRERIFSFLDVFNVFFRGDKYGDYFVFQRDEHISDLGNPTIPDEGLGVMSNALVEGAAGLFNISPYANASDALSVLGRRFWVNDFRLDGEFPPFQAGIPSYATLESNTNNPSAPDGDGRPVLPDLIDDVLNNNDQFRELRLAWLDFRVNREAGTLESAERFAKEIPKRRREELKQMRLAESVESIT
jgi:hypothetical protein